MNINFFIGALAAGGAERQMVLLSIELAARGHRVGVITIFPGGQMADTFLPESGVKLSTLWPKRGGNKLCRSFQLLVAPFLLRRLINKSDCIYSMLDMANIIAWLGTRLKPKPVLVWGIRSSNVEGHLKMAIADKLCSVVSATVKLVIVNSRAGSQHLLKRGYRPQQHAIITNGIDCRKFQFNKISRDSIRDEIGVSSTQVLIGIVGRLNPMKDHPAFLKAAALVANEISDVKFLVVGGGQDSYKKKLQLLAKNLGLEGHIIWLGERKDVTAIYSALDLLSSSSSYGEGFPNVIGEAMACGVPCVVTDVGDSAEIVGRSDCVVPPCSPEKLANRIIATLKDTSNSGDRNELRNRIANNFSVEKMINHTEELLGQLL